MSYLDKFKGVGERKSIYDILSLDETIKDENGNLIIKQYEAVGIETVKIDGNAFRNYGQYQFIWEKTFVKSPARSGSGSLGNLNSYATFLTPHLIMDFSIMSIDDYRAIMKLHYERNEFTVECYDPIYNRKIKVKMYFATEEMAKLYTLNKIRLAENDEWEEWIALVGVHEYKVELIGTNNDLDLVSVKYEYNSELTPTGAPMPPQYEEDIYLGEEIVVGENSNFPEIPPSNNLKFKHWIDEQGKVYNNGIVLTVNAPLTLYAVWESTDKFNLSFNYGLSDVDSTVDSATGVKTDIINREVQQGQSIGTLPKLTAEPFVTGADKVKYYPYTNGGWYKHPVKQEDMKVTSGMSYWTNRDTVIYALYDKKPFTVTYVTNVADTAIPTQTLYYGDQVYLPTLARDGYTFQGWYVDSELTKSFGGNMPPYPITLYAKWVAK